MYEVTFRDMLLSLNFTKRFLVQMLNVQTASFRFRHGCRVLHNISVCHPHRTVIWSLVTLGMQLLIG
jgi:hypothetical protein